jgi:(E)-4-hydroxy-3-methylbut-2-enyl-diphosphate synthase
MDTIGSVEQCIRMIEAGCEYVRITAPSIKEAENLANIKAELRRRGYQTPLVADIHFTPNAAEVAARIVEKVRVNPGNYADRKRFETIDYTDAQYEAELERIRAKFVPLVRICKEYGTAMRIGTNHGSLSDRIMSRYGDNPLGMVESALEFLRICEDENFFNIVISMKSSNPQVMVQAYRLLVNRLESDKFKPYPLHLGVTEAGDGEDGRIKSALGIGTLLEDGLGDTVRVSLTEEPEFEMPVGRKLVARYSPLTPEGGTQIDSPFGGWGASPPSGAGGLYNPFAYTRRETHEVAHVGKLNVPRVITDFSQIENLEMADFKAFGYTYLPLTDKWGSNDTASDFVYLGKQKVPFMMPNGLKAIQDYDVWKDEKELAYPLFESIYALMDAEKVGKTHSELNFVHLEHINTALMGWVHQRQNIVLIVQNEVEAGFQEVRDLLLEFITEGKDLFPEGIKTPIIFKRSYPAHLDTETLQLYSATDIGGLLIDGFGDGVMLSLDALPVGKSEALACVKTLNQIAFGILQAARTRITKTEYISCPSCGRTLFDLQETTAKIRQRTEHLKGIKIGIMGCIVNGPGEMADADYGYVGSGKDRITLYRGQTVVKKSVHADKAVDELIEIIKEDGRWIEVPELVA